jgi:hypothetical protein
VADPERSRHRQQTGSVSDPRDHDTCAGGTFVSSCSRSGSRLGGGSPSPPQIDVMIRTLLADRFKLTVHLAMKELPVYALVLTRSDRRLPGNHNLAYGDPVAFDSGRPRSWSSSLTMLNGRHPTSLTGHRAGSGLTSFNAMV